MHTSAGNLFCCFFWGGVRCSLWRSPKRTRKAIAPGFAVGPLWAYARLRRVLHMFTAPIDQINLMGAFHVPHLIRRAPSQVHAPWRPRLQRSRGYEQANITTQTAQVAQGPQRTCKAECPCGSFSRSRAQDQRRTGGAGFRPWPDSGPRRTLVGARSEARIGAWALYAAACAYFFGSFLAKRNINIISLNKQQKPNQLPTPTQQTAPRILTPPPKS